MSMYLRRVALEASHYKGEIIMTTKKEIAYNVAYEKYHTDYDANYIAYQAAMAACEATFKAAEHAAWEAYDKKQSKAEESATWREKDVAIALAKRARDAAKAFAEGSYIYKRVGLDAAIGAATNASYDADAGIQGDK